MKYACLVDAPWNARLALTAAPADEPVSLAELKQHTRVDGADDNGYLAAASAAARQWVEQYLGRQLVTATWTLTLDGFPSDGSIEIPRPPLISVTSVKYYDAARVQQTFAVASYHVHSYAGPESPMGRIELASGATWPTTYGGEGAVQIAYQAGYGAAAAVPPQIKQAVLILAAELYERREQQTVGTIVTPNAITVERLLWPLRVW
jgi:uncharacterized phiE125 gp8 family phage protein